MNDSHTWAEYEGDVVCIVCDSRPWGKSAKEPCESETE